MKRLFILGLFFTTFFVVFNSCKDDNNYEKMRKDELELLNTYINKYYTEDDYIKTPSGLYYVETEQGTGDTIKVGDNVKIFYATWALHNINGTDSLILVDESSGYTSGYRYEPYELTVGSSSSITGLEEGVTYMKPGGKSRLIINSELAYGQQGSGSVGAFRTLVMDVEIYKVFPYGTP